MSTHRVTRPWTKAEDSTLRDAVSKFSQAETIDWHRVASHLSRRNNKECRKRWVYSLESKISKGPWDEEEDRCLRNGVAKHGLKWAAVAEVVGSRQPDQCSRRWHEVVNPRISHERWSLYEDTVLKEAVDNYGRKWTEIVERFFPNRTPISARNRYKQRYEGRGSVTSADERCGSTSSDDQGAANLLWTIPDHSQTRNSGYEAPSVTNTPPAARTNPSSQWIPTSSTPQSHQPTDSTAEFNQLNMAMASNPFAQQQRPSYPNQASLQRSTGGGLQPMPNNVLSVNTLQTFGAGNANLLADPGDMSSFDGSQAYPSPMTTQSHLANSNLMPMGMPHFSPAIAYGYNAMSTPNATAGQVGVFQSPASYSPTSIAGPSLIGAEDRRIKDARALGNRLVAKTPATRH